jgi:hypothetical protein
LRDSPHRSRTSERRAGYERASIVILALGRSLAAGDYLAQRIVDDGTGLVVDTVDSIGIPTGVTLPQLEKSKRTYGRWKGAFSGAYLPLSGMTLEGRAALADPREQSVAPSAG